MSQPPVAVSPLIKFGRWSMLSLGIIYGIYNQKRLTEKEQKFREADAEQKAIRAQIAKEKQRLAKAEMHAIDILSGKIH